MTDNTYTRTFLDMADVRAANKASGQHWFSRSTMRFFNSVVESPLYHGRYFITSERYMDDAAKLYSVRVVQDDAGIDTVGEFQAYISKADAREAIRALVAS